MTSSTRRILLRDDPRDRFHVLYRRIAGLHSPASKIIFLHAQTEEETAHILICVRDQDGALPAAAFPWALKAVGGRRMTGWKTFMPSTLTSRSVSTALVRVPTVYQWADGWLIRPGAHTLFHIDVRGSEDHLDVGRFDGLVFSCSKCFINVYVGRQLRLRSHQQAGIAARRIPQAMCSAQSQSQLYKSAIPPLPSSIACKHSSMRAHKGVLNAASKLSTRPAIVLQARSSAKRGRRMAEAATRFGS